MKIKLYDLAHKFNLGLVGNENHEVNGVATLEKAQKNHLSFLSNSKYKPELETTNAGIVVLSKADSDLYKGNKLIAKDPYVAFAKIANLFQGNHNLKREIHKTAIIASSAKISHNVSIGAYCVVGENVVISRDTILDNHVEIENDCVIGSGCWIKSQTMVSHGCQLGDRVLLHPGVVIGADGFGLARDVNGWIKVPQMGAVYIGDDCEIGANTTIDRGTIDNTVLENDVRLDNQIQIAHNVHIGAHTVMAGCSAVAGSAKIGKNCLIGGGVGIIGHLEVCDNVTLQSMALVTHSIKKPGSYSSVAPLQDTKDWRKSAVRIKQLNNMAKRLSVMENKFK